MWVKITCTNYLSICLLWSFVGVSPNANQQYYTAGNSWMIVIQHMHTGTKKNQCFQNFCNSGESFFGFVLTYTQLCYKTDNRDEAHCPLNDHSFECIEWCTRRGGKNCFMASKRLVIRVELMNQLQNPKNGIENGNKIKTWNKKNQSINEHSYNRTKDGPEELHFIILCFD